MVARGFPHAPVAPAHRHGHVRLAQYELGGHLVWAATDDAGVVALAGSRDELERVLAE
ncbi:hypothetical protein [Frankia sp. ArI3]|uniref:hypothetical protein n=1 Tax=Frankia sp. ArI3 TaxID=1858 RepID=UPI001C6FCE8A|nr:hypothetical protein [Frankia sp. ArI3]